MLEDKSVRVILNSDVIKEIEPLPKNAELEKVYSSIDPLLKNIMCILWSNNIVTRYSCEGHEENEEGAGRTEVALGPDQGAGVVSGGGAVIHFLQFA